MQQSTYQKDKTNSMGLWTYANNYLDAARVLVSSSDRDLVPTPAYYLICHSIELTLKAYLRGSGEELKRLRKIGHNLNQCLSKAGEKGLAQYHCLKPSQEKAVSLINDYYESKELEYISTGFKTLPTYKVLDEVADELLLSLREYCQRNMKCHDEKS